MRLLALIRHGSYDYGSTGYSDADRPLDAEGRRGVAAVARELASAGFEPEQVISGAAARTLETARVIAVELGVAESEIDVRPDLYHARREHLLAMLASLDDDRLQVALVGHHPGIAELCALLTDRRVSSIPFSGAAWMELQIDAWAEIGYSSALNVQLFEAPVAGA